MNEKGYIKSEQEDIFGKSEVIGFGTSDFHIKEIDRIKANKIIMKNHYSKKFFNLSTIHLGVYINNELKGVLQFGYAMNPASCDSVVTGTKVDEYLELNRMFIHDLPQDVKNIESRAISYSIKYIKKMYPKVKWIQSFADERCKLFGLVYQACNFDYYGEHSSVFWELDGVMYHKILMTVTDENKKSPTAKMLQENKDRAIAHELRQFRYIFFIDKRVKKNCTLEQKPYPKWYKEGK